MTQKRREQLEAKLKMWQERRDAIQARALLDIASLRSSLDAAQRAVRQVTADIERCHEQAMREATAADKEMERITALLTALPNTSET